jgi:hypothetical protein
VHSREEPVSLRAPPQPAARPPVSDLRGNTDQISPPFISTNDEFRQLMAAIGTVLSAQEAK